jgi:hypothetical protein
MTTARRSHDMPAASTRGSPVDLSRASWRTACTTGRAASWRCCIATAGGLNASAGVTRSIDVRRRTVSRSWLLPHDSKRSAMYAHQILMQQTNQRRCLT